MKMPASERCIQYFFSLQPVRSRRQRALIATPNRAHSPAPTGGIQARLESLTQTPINGPKRSKIPAP